MNFNDYQTEMAKTAAARIEGPEMRLAIWGLGLAGESGEVVELVKKHLGHGVPLNRDKLAKELGDVLWYLAMIGTELGISLQNIAELNIAKIRARYPNGFTTEASVARADEDVPSVAHMQGPRAQNGLYYVNRWGQVVARRDEAPTCDCEECRLMGPVRVGGT